MTAAPIIAASAMSRMSLKRMARLNQHFGQRPIRRGRVAEEIHQQDGIAHDNTSQRDKADHRGGGERRLEQSATDQNADENQRDRRQDNQEHLERAELCHHQDIDAEDGNAKAPMSRKVTRITSHSPSQSRVGLISSSG